MILIEILEQIQNDITYHDSAKNHFFENTPEWSFHLGWVDALTSYRYKLKRLVSEEKENDY